MMLDRIIAFGRMLIRLLRDKCGDMPVPDIISKTRKAKTPIPLAITTLPAGYNPSQTQIDTFARRLIPGIKSFFFSEQTQQEYADWLERQPSD